MIVHIIFLIFSVVLAGAISNRTTAAYDMDETINLTKKDEPQLSLLFMLFSYSVFIFFAAFRTEYSDTSVYIALFNRLPTGFWSAIDTVVRDYNDSGLFWGVSVLIKTAFGPNSIMFLLIITVYCILGNLVLFKNYSCDFKLTTFFYFIATEYIWILNGMKQATAIATVLFFSKALFEKKFSKFAVGVAIAYFFHPSALLWIPIYFFIHEEPWTKKMILFIVALLASVIFLDVFTGVLGSVLEGTVYEGQTENFSTDTGVSILRTIFYFVPPYISFVHRGRIEEIAPHYIKVCINLSVVTAGIFLIASFTSGILMGRLPGYFTIFNCVLMPWLFKNVLIEEKSYYRTIITGVYIAFYIFDTIIAGKGVYESTYLNIYNY